jgi:hypothetical protein
MRRIVKLGLWIAATAALPSTAMPQTAEAPFLAQSNAAMMRMDQDMNTKPTGDIDRDFVAMMVPHHQGAIDMAQAELQYGHNETLRRIAQEIVVEQQQEIAAMHLAIGDPLPASKPSPDQPGSSTMPPSKMAPMMMHKDH